MKFKFVIAVLCTCAGLLFCPPCYSQLESLYRPFFPLGKGSYWVYQGVARWTDFKTQQALIKEITWTMKITDVIMRGILTAAVVQGHPKDLAWYEEGLQPGNYLIINLGNKYYLVEGERFEEVLQRLKNENDDLKDLVQEDELFLEESSSGVAHAFGDPQQLTRSDWLYFWYVEDVSQVSLKDLKGLETEGLQLQYRLAYRSAPDDVHVDIVPGVGITRYIYNHHGTVAQADVWLIEYSPGQEDHNSGVVLLKRNGK